MAIDHIIGVIGSKPGIARDGTVYDRDNYIDGQWCRFYLNKPRKIGGYTLSSPGSTELVRNMYVVSKQNTIDVYLGRPFSLEVVNIQLNNAPGLAGPEFTRTPVGFVPNINNQWTFDLFTVLSGAIPLPLNAATAITTSAGSHVVTVTTLNPLNGQLQNNDYVTIQGIVGPVDTLTTDQLNITAPITLVPGNPFQFTYVTTGAAAVGVGAGGGANGTFTPSFSHVALGVDPLLTANASNVVIVTVPTTSGLINGQSITIYGAVGFNGVTADQFNITAPFTILGPTTFSYIIPVNAGGGPFAGGGAAVIYVVAGSATYIVAVAPPNATDINNNIESLIYWGDVRATTPLAQISTTFQKTSGGIVTVGPYLMKYGNDGVVVATLRPGGDWSDAIAFPVAGTKIVKGLVTRGGSNAPAALFWSLNSVIRCTFVGQPSTFNFDTIQANTTIMSANCVVTVDNEFYWIGLDRFYVYNGVVQKLDNVMSRDYFFDNLNWDVRSKVWGMYLPLDDEIWWFYPTLGSLECNAAIMYNKKGGFWFDSVIGRSAGVPPGFYQYPIMADSNRTLNQFAPHPTTTVNLANNPIQTNINSFMVTVTVPSTVGINTGDLVIFANILTVGGIPAADLNILAPVTIVDPTTLTYNATALAISTANGGGNTPATMTFTSNLTYAIWTHEVGTDQVAYGQNLAIDSYFETNLTAFFDSDVKNDRQMRIRRLEPDFVMTGNMTVTVNSRHFAQTTVQASTPYTFIPGQTTVLLSKIDMINMGRLISYRFESNTLGGNYQMCKVLLSYAPGDVYP